MPEAHELSVSLVAPGERPHTSKRPGDSGAQSSSRDPRQPDVQSTAVRLLPLLVCTVALAGCGNERGAQAPQFCGPDVERVPCTSARTGVEYPVSVWTHCGVGHAYFAGRYWVIEPAQPEAANSVAGVMTLVARDLVEFQTETRRFFFEPAPRSFSPPPCY